MVVNLFEYLILRNFLTVEKILLIYLSNKCKLNK